MVKKMFIKKLYEYFMKKLYERFTKLKSNLKLTFECYRNPINFLDLNVKLGNSELTTNIYIKPTNRHQCFHYR